MIKKYLGRKETDKGEVDEWKGMNVSGAPRYEEGGESARY